MNDIFPLYVDGNNEPHKGDGELLHFTSAKSFFKILEDLTLLPSMFTNLNDLNEGNVYNMDMNKNFPAMYDADKYIKEKCRVLCFSQNYDINGFGFSGVNHPAMWGHYADNSNGVCIAISKKAFIAKNRDILEKYFSKFEDVKYKTINTPRDSEIDYSPTTAEAFIKQNWEGLFFLKHEDWRNEDEHRLFIMDYDGKFSIDGCIRYVVLGRIFFSDKKQLKRLMNKIVNPNSFVYKKFHPQSFATANYSPYGYTMHSAAFIIHEIVGRSCSQNKCYRDYYEWCKKVSGN